MDVLTPDTVQLAVRAANKADAIRQSGEVLVSAGYVAPSYVDGMLARESVLSTYLGSGIAIPHGEVEDLATVYHPGVSVLQLPQGVQWEPGEVAHLVIGLAATRTSQEHVVILANILELLQTPDSIMHLVRASDPMIIVERLMRSPAGR